MESPLISFVPPETSRVTRRTVLHRALATSGIVGLAAIPHEPAFAQETPPSEKRELGSATLALALARLFNRPRFVDLSPTAIKHAEMIIASTLASSAPGSLIGSA